MRVQGNVQSALQAAALLVLLWSKASGACWSCFCCTADPSCAVGVVACVVLFCCVLQAAAQAEGGCHQGQARGTTQQQAAAISKSRNGSSSSSERQQQEQQQQEQQQRQAASSSGKRQAARGAALAGAACESRGIGDAAGLAVWFVRALLEFAVCCTSLVLSTHTDPLPLCPCAPSPALPPVCVCV